MKEKPLLRHFCWLNILTRPTEHLFLSRDDRKTIAKTLVPFGKQNKWFDLMWTRCELNCSFCDSIEEKHMCLKFECKNNEILFGRGNWSRKNVEKEI